MSQLIIPKGWQKKTLEDVTLKISDIDHKMPPKTKEGFPLISTKDFTDDDKIDFSKSKIISKTDYERLRKKCDPQIDDILFSRIGTIGKAVKVDTTKKFTISYSLVLVKPDIEEVLPDFLLYYFRSPLILQQARRDTNSIGTPDLGIKKIRSFKIAIPSIPIQKQIVSKLNRILKEIKIKENQITKLRSQTQNEITFLKENYMNFIISSHIPGEGFPKHWISEKLGNTFTEISEKWQPNTKSETLNFIGLENIQSNTGKLVKFSPSNSNSIKSTKSIFSSSDVLYGKLRPNLNKVFLPKFDGICSTDILVLRPNTNILKEFLAYFLRSKFALTKIKTYGERPRIKIDDLKNVSFGLPEIPEQKKIIKKLNFYETHSDSMNNFVESFFSQDKKISEDTERLYSKILEMAFSGKLAN